jgi:hypothetical protein
MAFEPGRAAELPENVLSWVKDGRLYASVPREDCDRVVRLMLEAGYSLREMRDEDGV